MESRISIERTGEHARSAGHKVKYLVLLITSLVLLLNYADRAALGVAGSEIIHEFKLTNTEFGLISSVFFVGYAPFCFVGGWLSDKYGPRSIMAIAGCWWSIFTALTAAGTGFLSFMVVRFLFGFGEGPQGAITVKTMSNWFPQRQMGMAVGISQGATPLGGALGTPLVAALIASTGDWRIPFIVLGVLGVLMMIGWWVIVRDTPHVHPWVGRPDQLEPAVAEKKPTEEENNQPARPLSWYLRQPLVLATSAAFFAYAWVLYTFLSWFPVYLVEDRGINLKAFAFAGALPWLLGMVGYMAGGVITDKIALRTGKPAAARRGMIIFGLLGTAALMALLGNVSSAWSAVAVMSAVVMLLYLTGSQYFLIISDTIPGKRLGGVVGFVHFIANSSGILAPLLVGMLVDYTKSWPLTFGLCAAICLLGALVILIWGKPRNLS
ncbi:MFS transporter [Paramixta manurensis]|uniref:MFS transporter n=1 Tax=Paramixta manurensis TaxID=2740817 RepID=A0A6M8ULJ1_9GAMM|nr:MFS transporter [Erwiniaceae bacterium PD-1]